MAFIKSQLTSILKQIVRNAIKTANLLPVATFSKVFSGDTVNVILPIMRPSCITGEVTSYILLGVLEKSSR